MPVWSFYYVALVWVGKLMAISLGVCAVIAFLANIQVRSWRIIVFPLYAFVQAFLMPLVGSIYYLILGRRQRFLGRYRFGYRMVKVFVTPRLRKSRGARRQLATR